MLGVDEILDHARFQRSWAIEGDQGDEIGELFRRHVNQQFSHAAALKLENAERITTAEQLEGFQIVHVNGRNVELLAAVTLDVIKRLFNHRQGFQTEKIELDQAGLLRDPDQCAYGVEKIEEQQGKGQRDRIVFLTATAAAALRCYLATVPHAPGDLVAIGEADFVYLPPIATVLGRGDKEEEVPVQLSLALTEIGTSCRFSSFLRV